MTSPSQVLGVRIMSFQGRLLTSEIATIFAEEIAAQGGTVTDTFDDGARLFQRAVLPDEREVQHRDRVQGGVALRATDDDVWIHPYVFRKVCSNGAIIARAIQTRHIERSEFVSYDDAEVELAGAVREAIRDCCAPEAFENATEAIRSSNAGINLSLSSVDKLNVGGKFYAHLPDKRMVALPVSRPPIEMGVPAATISPPKRTATLSARASTSSM